MKVKVKVKVKGEAVVAMKNKKYRKQLAGRVEELGKRIDRLDWERVPGAQRLSDEELEALHIGAVAATAAVSQMLGAVGKDHSKADISRIAYNVAVASVMTHLSYNVDGPEVRVTIEREG